MLAYWYLVPYQCVEIDRIHPEARVSRYVSIPPFWEEIESCGSMGVDLPLVITYVGSLLISDPGSGLWVVAVTQWVAKYAAFVLWDVYDTFRLWFVPPVVRGHIRDLDLSFVLGSNEKYREFIKFSRRC